MIKNIILTLLLVPVLNAKIKINPEVEHDCIFTRSPLIISKNVESDEGFNSLLSRYFHLCLIGESIKGLNQDSLSVLFKRPSFSDLSLELLSSMDLLQQINVFYPDEQFERLDEYSVNILYNCHDSSAVYSIADKLLKDGNVKGLIALWNNCHTPMLKNYNTYKQKVITHKSKYKLVALIIVNHNSKYFEERDELMSQLYTMDSKLYYKLHNLLYAEDLIDYPTFLFDI